MFGRLSMQDGPITGRINPFGRASRFGAIVPPADEPLPVMPEASPVSRALEPPFRAPTVPEALQAIRVALVNLEGASQERDALLSDVIGIGDRIEALLSATKEQRRAHLSEQLTQVIAAGRACLVELNQARAEVSRLQALWNGQESSASAARAKLQALRNTRPNDDQWPTEAEIASWKNAVTVSEAEVERWRTSQNELMTQLEAANGKARGIARRLAELRGRREDLRAELAGKPRRGPHGLEIPAGT